MRVIVLSKLKAMQCLAGSPRSYFSMCVQVRGHGVQIPHVQCCQVRLLYHGVLSYSDEAHRVIQEDFCEARVEACVDDVCCDLMTDDGCLSHKQMMGGNYCAVTMERVAGRTQLINQSWALF